MLDQTNTFVINLPFRDDRARSVEAELGKIGLPFRFWRAICKANGVVGLLETMKALMEHCVASGFKQALILEDDIQIIEDWSIAEQAMKELPGDYDAMYLGCNLCQPKVEKYSEHLIPLTAGYATHGILYSAKGMEKLLRILNNGSVSPLDVQIVHGIQCDFKCYQTFPMVATQRDNFSNIENREVKYKQFLEQRFADKTFHL